MGSVGSNRNSIFTLTTPEEIDDILMDMNDEDFKRQVNSRSEWYFGRDFGRELNAFLASGLDEYLYERPDYQVTIKRLDEAMAPISKSITSERYVDERTLPGFNPEHPERMVGQTIHTPGYLSTTVDAENSKFEFINYPAKVIITAPTGTKAILGANDKEAEVLYHRNSNYTITGYRMSKNSVGDPQVIYFAKLKRSR